MIKNPWFKKKKYTGHGIIVEVSLSRDDREGVDEDFVGYVTVSYMKGAPKLYTDSLVLHRLRNVLQDAGLDVIKKRMDKDGHLTGCVHYVRSRNRTPNHPFIYIYDNDYALRFTYQDLNKAGKVTYWLLGYRNREKKCTLPQSIE